MENNRVPPHSVDAERCVIGTILLSNRALDEINLLPEDFYRDSHRDIFQAITTLRSSGAPADLVTICELLKANDKLEFVGGPTYLATMTDIIPSVANVGHYAKIVSDHKKRREAIVAASNIIGMAYESADIENLTEAAQTAFFGIESNGGCSVDIQTLVAQQLKKIESRKGGNAIPGLATGFYDLDNSTAGFHEPDLVVLAGRPSHGKTAIAMNMVNNIAGGGVPVGIFSLEMSAGQLAERQISSNSNVSAGRIRTGNLSGQNWDDISLAAVKMSKMNIHIDDSPALPVSEIRRRARRWKMRHNIGLLVVDYMQLAKSAKARGREQEISDISQQLKATAKELKIPVLAIAQLNRDLEKRPDKRPILADLRDSGQIEQDGDLIMFVYRDEVYNKNHDNPNKGMAELIIAKQRNGPLGVVKLSFHGETMTFRNLA